MALLNPAAVSEQPELRREVVAVPALGGDVLVVELTLTGRLDFEKVLRDDFESEAQPAASPSEVKAADERPSRRSVHAIVPHLLAATVLGAGDAPLMGLAQWQRFGARHKSVAIQLANVAFRLNGFDADDNAKN